MLNTLFSLLRDVMFFSAYVSGGSSFPGPLSPEEERDCIERIKKGDEDARTKLIEHNLRLVAHIAKKYIGQGRESDDVISIGTIGLIKGVSTYKADKGTSLATYCARCIDNEILMSIRSEKKRMNEVSLHLPIGTDRDGNDISLVEILGSDENMVPDEVALRIAADQLKALMKKHLNDREHLVVELRYGLRNGRLMPQREIADLLKISRSYVSRIEKKALEKLKIELNRVDPS